MIWIYEEKRENNIENQTFTMFLLFKIWKTIRIQHVLYIVQYNKKWIAWMLGKYEHLFPQKNQMSNS